MSKFAGLVAAGVLITFGAAPSSAQDYPSKPIRLVVPYPPGSGTDIVGRLLAQRLGESLGQQVYVDNRPGAGATIGTAFVAKGTPDGYTILMADLVSFPTIRSRNWPPSAKSLCCRSCSSSTHPSPRIMCLN
jgi:tripartite-type tricarboxylate transporter receptor subunit TctC